MTFINRCYECDKYYVDNKHIIYVNKEYYCMLCFKTNSDLFINILKMLCKRNDIDMVNKIIN